MIMMMLTAIGFFLLGLATWSFAEYAIHNWVGHLGKGRNEFSREHLAHHKDPHYFARTSKKALTTLMVMIIVSPLACYGMGLLGGILFSVGFVLTYVSYEVLHRRVHTVAPGSAYTRYMYKHHLLHHFGSPKTNHGVTSPIWDVVFRTFVKPGLIRVPEKDAMTWLCDESGAVKPEYTDDYLLIQRQTSAVERSESALSAR
ncbi:MAG: sterol desaturase family protein [Planctomycetota bacterium]|nr:sterol desaturase family protein [Planctomycetota bacterium]